MQEKIYIEKTDEITVIVDRLRRSKAAQCLLIVPKQSLVLQSAINMRLLKNEAEKYHKDIIIVTKDKDGALLAERAGLDTRPTVEEQAKESAQTIVQKELPGEDAEDDLPAEEDDDDMEELPPRPKTIGSSDFFAGGGGDDDVKQPSTKVNFRQSRKLVTQNPPQQEDGPKVTFAQAAAAAAAGAPVEPSQEKTQPVPIQQPQEAVRPSPPQQQSAPPQEQPVHTSAQTKPSFTPARPVPQQASVQPTQQAASPQRPMTPPRPVMQPQQRPAPAALPQPHQPQPQQSVPQRPAPRQHARPRMKGDIVIRASEPRRPVSQKEQPSKPAPQQAPTPPPEPKDNIKKADDFWNGYKARGTDPFTAARTAAAQQQPQGRRPQGAPSPATQTVHSARSFSRLSRWLVFGAVAVILFVVAFSVLPFTTMTIVAKRADVSADATFDARAAITTADLERRLIPARLVSKTVTLTETFPATGESSASVHKARGRLTISNAFSTEPQALRATTRFETPDGKIFRLIRGVTVPGGTLVDGTLQPGELTVDVEADQGGEDFNIAPTTFTIPGFAGGPKFTKFTARSDAPMRGGATSGTTLTVVSQADIDAAKASVEEQFTAKSAEEMLALIKEQGGGVFAEDLMRVTITDSASALLAEVAADEFAYTVTADVQALTFSETDVLTVLEETLQEKAGDPLTLAQDDVTLTFETLTPNFEEQQIGITAKGSATFAAEIDQAAFGEDLYGKDIAAVREIIVKDYKESIDRVEMSFVPSWPAFFARRISPIPQMLNVVIE